MKPLNNSKMILAAFGAFAMSLALTMSLEKWGVSLMPLGLPTSAALSAVASIVYVIGLKLSAGFSEKVRNPLVAAVVGVAGGGLAAIIVSIAAGAIYLAFGAKGIVFGFGGSLYLLFTFIAGGLLWSLAPVLALGASVGLRACCCRQVER